MRNYFYLYSLYRNNFFYREIISILLSEYKKYKVLINCDESKHILCDCWLLYANLFYHQAGFYSDVLLVVDL